MALTHTLIETRPYLNSWLVILYITDTDTGLVYNRRFNIGHDPSGVEVEALAVTAKTRIQDELDYQVNDLNLTTDEDSLLEHYRNIKRDLILRIRQVPGATLQQAQDYIAGEYPNSPFDFVELYAIWCRMISVATWPEFKTWVIDHKFREID